MRTIAVLNQKGGVGKTTTVVNTAAALASFGAKVLTIDFDPQAHLTIHLGVEPQSIDSGSYKVLTQSARIESEIMMVRDNLWLLPANIDLVGAESELVSVVGREIILREALDECQQDFDYCLIDCAPSLGLLTLNALAAAQEVLIPLQPHFLALQGFGKLLQTVEIVNRRINPNLRVNGILLCMFDSRASLPNEVKADIERFLNDARGTNSAWSDAHVLPVLVRRNIKLAEAPSYGKTIFEYENQCNGAQDYQKVGEFIHYKKLLSDESNEAVDIEQNAEQLESFNAEYQPEDSQQEQEFEAQISDNQDNNVETEIEVSQENEEPEEYYTLSDESEPSEEYQEQEQITEQEESQPEYSEPVEEVASENNEIQNGLDTIEQEYYTPTEENVESNEFQAPEETPEQPEQTQPETQSEYQEPVEEVSSDDTDDIQNELNKIENKISQIETGFNPNGYVIPKFEQLQKNGFHNVQRITEPEQQNQSEIQPENSEHVEDSSPEGSEIQENHDQPEQFESQPDYSNEVPKKPPFEIREIQTHSSPEPEQQYTQSSEEQNQPEQNEDNPHSEHQGY